MTHYVDRAGLRVAEVLHAFRAKAKAASRR
jgi:hypothetical protein